MSNLPFSIPAPGGTWSWTPNTPGAVAGQSGFTLPSLPNLSILGLPNLQSLIPGGSGGAPDLSGLLSTLAPILGAAVPQLAPFLPIIGVLFNILHALTTKNNAAVASGAPNPDLQAVHDAAWSQVLTAFGQRPAAVVPSSG